MAGLHFSNKDKAAKESKYTYEVLEDLGEISRNGDYSRRLKYMRWNEYDPKYYIYSWKGDQKGRGSGASFTAEELVELYKVIGKLIEESGVEID